MVMRFLAWLPLLLLAAACGQGPEGLANTAEVPASAEEDAESGQGRALEAGRALVGKPAPAAVLRTIDGDTIDLSTIYGRKPVYLKFWATWCIPCREQMPGFKADHEKFRDRIVTLAVNTGFNDSDAAVRDYRREHGLSMPIAMDDGSLGAALNLRVTPQHVVVGRDGRILYVGHLDDDRLDAALRQAVAQAPAGIASVAVAAAPASLDPALARVAGFPLSGPVGDRRPRVLVFFSPWCESYYQESRPELSEACRRTRMDVKRLAGTVDARWLGIASGLWTSAKDFNDYESDKDAYRIPLHLDSSGAAFRAYGVRDVPTVIILDAEGRIARRLGPNDRDLSAAVRAASTGP